MTWQTCHTDREASIEYYSQNQIGPEPKQFNECTMMRRLSLLIAMFVKHPYVLTGKDKFHQAYATVSRSQRTLEDLPLIYRDTVTEASPLLNVKERWRYTV